MGRPSRKKSIEARLKAYELDPYNDFLSSMVAQTYKRDLNDEKMAFQVLDKILDKDSTANFCSRIKSGFIAGAPEGDLVNAFITLHKSLQGDKYEKLNLDWMIGFSLNLDLVPLAVRYMELEELKYPNSQSSFRNRYDQNAIKKDYKANVDLVKIWADEKGFNEGMDTYWLANTYLRMGNPVSAKSTMDAGFPKLAELLTEFNPMDSLPYSNYVDEFDMYIDILRALGNEEVASQLAEKSCEYYRELIAELSWQGSPREDLTMMYCYYNRHEVDSLIYTLDRLWFKDKERMGFYLFAEYLVGFFQPFEEDEQFKLFMNRVTTETHRMRAEVIAYLKEVGDWNEAWDKELGLE